MDEEWRCTLFVNDTRTEIRIKYNGGKYVTLKPKSVDSVRWSIYDRCDTCLPKVELEGVELDHEILWKTCMVAEGSPSSEIRTNLATLSGLSRFQARMRTRFHYYHIGFQASCFGLPL